MMQKTDQAYRAATEYILNIPKFSGKHTMEETRAFYEFLGEPCRNQRIIHVAGTNGKGSVCAYLRNVLEEAGYHTAAFISPHLVSVRERFLFDKDMVSKAEFIQAYDEVRRQVQAFEERCKGYHPSFFEFLFFMFLMMQKTGKADYIILETGLGGRLDATNVMPEKTLCIITEIGLDHTEYLGDTVRQIAGEKAGILRTATPVVYAADKQESAEVIKEQAKAQKAMAYPVGRRDFKIERIQDKNIAFSFHSVYYNSISVILRTTALYQVENASLALRALDVLNLQGAGILEDQIVRGMQKTYWEGRMEEVFPDVYIDGAHNEDGIRAFLASVRQLSVCETETDRKSGAESDKKQPEYHNSLLFAVVQDKRYDEMLRMIAESGLFHKISITTTGGSRGTDPREMLSILQQYHRGECNYYESAEEAFDACIGSKKEGERIYIAGSLYLAGQIKAYIGRNSDD